MNWFERAMSAVRSLRRRGVPLEVRYYPRMGMFPARILIRKEDGCGVHVGEGWELDPLQIEWMIREAKKPLLFPEGGLEY
jgi:hypothetical protein